MRVVVIIPARYASTRFPAKPLAVLGRKCIIEWVYCAAKRVFDDVVVATDDNRIRSAVESFGGRVVMTSSEHSCGTERCAEALSLLDKEYDIVVNVQGDEPFIRAEQLTDLVAMFDNPNIDIATLATPIAAGDSADVHRSDIVKVALSRSGRALYFSRSAIPFVRDVEPRQWGDRAAYYRHLGIYAFRSSVLQEITRLKPTELELAERLEQLRWLENDYAVGVAITPHSTIGIDTPEDLVRAEEYIANSDNCK